jgi:hypothetical protein
MARRHLSKARTRFRTSLRVGDQWDLSHLFQRGEPDVAQALRRLEGAVAQFESLRDQLTPDISTAS